MKNKRQKVEFSGFKHGGEFNEPLLPGPHDSDFGFSKPNPLSNQEMVENNYNKSLVGVKKRTAPNRHTSSLPPVGVDPPTSQWPYGEDQNLAYQRQQEENRL
jgi:hypothetical protein